MLLPEGNLFHIDFGYIFGRDPKPMAPPFRLTREMADAMGGVNSEDYKLFKTYCCQVRCFVRVCVRELRTTCVVRYGHCDSTVMV